MADADIAWLAYARVRIQLNHAAHDSQILTAFASSVVFVKRKARLKTSPASLTRWMLVS